MGAGASVDEGGQQVQIDKKIVVSHLKKEYEAQTQRPSIKEEELFQHLKAQYHQVVLTAKEGPVSGDDMKNSAEAAGEIERMTDADLAGAASASAANLMASTGGSNEGDFRKRRLSVISKPKPIDNKEETETSGSTFFRSADIGQETPTPSPFPTSVVGTYSVPGIEPSWDDEGVTSKINQDRGCVVYPFASDDTQSFFAVYDGHGERGDLVSHFVMSNMYKVLEDHPGFKDDLKQALIDTFVKIDTMLVERKIECTFSGTTAVAVVLRDNEFTIANCGDSRAVLGTMKGGKMKGVNLSDDHNPDKDEEKERILQSGGFVSPPPEPGLSARVWLDPEMTQIGLAMARSIGDRAVKHIGVIAEPEISYHTLQKNDQFIILASDGVWEFIDSQEACEIVNKNLSKGSAHACQVLIENAAERWRLYEGDYRDDITAVVIQLPCYDNA